MMAETAKLTKGGWLLLVAKDGGSNLAIAGGRTTAAVIIFMITADTFRDFIMQEKRCLSEGADEGEVGD